LAFLKLDMKPPSELRQIISSSRRSGDILAAFLRQLGVKRGLERLR
jgi:hypothetical protein